MPHVSADFNPSTGLAHKTRPRSASCCGRRSGDARWLLAITAPPSAIDADILVMSNTADRDRRRHDPRPGHLAGLSKPPRAPVARRARLMPFRSVNTTKNSLRIVLRRIARPPRSLWSLRLPP